MSRQYPMLAFIERGVDDGAAAFTTSPHAARLEQRARDLVEAFWSDTVWLTGLVSEAAFHRVQDALQRERVALDDGVMVPSAPVPFAIRPTGVGGEAESTARVA